MSLWSCWTCRIGLVFRQWNAGLHYTLSSFDTIVGKCAAELVWCKCWQLCNSADEWRQNLVRRNMIIWSIIWAGRNWLLMSVREPKTTINQYEADISQPMTTINQCEANVSQPMATINQCEADVSQPVTIISVKPTLVSQSMTTINQCEADVIQLLTTIN